MPVLGVAIDILQLLRCAVVAPSVDLGVEIVINRGTIFVLMSIAVTFGTFALIERQHRCAVADTVVAGELREDCSHARAVGR